jgi:hypothetical protein
MAVQRAQQQNALAQMQMEQAQRDVEQQNNLRQFLPTMRPEDRQQLLGYGQAGSQVYESLLKGEKETREAEKAAADVAAARMRQSRDLLPSVTTPEAYANWRAYTLKNLPGLANIIPQQYTPEGVRGLMLEADKALEQHFVTQDLSGGKQVLSMPKYGGGPAAVVPGSAAATLPLPPDVEAQKARIALAGRPPAQPREPAAPTIAQIQDPTDSMRMITVDARRYKGGGVGSPGVIGTTGKTAPAAAAEQKKVEGQQAAADIIDTLRAAYQDLDERRAVPSEQRNVLSNSLSYIASTGIGQIAGRMRGTPEQTQRDIIQSARNQILNAVKNATGMSAQQLNSNIEFKSWVESLTDPTKSYEANTAILDNLEKFIASGGKYNAKKGGAAPSAPNVDELLKKYR